jgi:uroporphyrinogen-III synthase
LRAGVEPAFIDSPDGQAGQFDSEALWNVVEQQIRPGFQVLIVRGAEAHDGTAVDALEGVGRDWFARQVQDAGGSVEFLVSYQRRSPLLSQADMALMRSAAVDGSVWLFSSSQAITNLCARSPLLRWTKARAVATHPRIAQAARDAGFGVVCESRPVMAAVAASIESLA